MTPNMCLTVMMPWCRLENLDNYHQAQLDAPFLSYFEFSLEIMTRFSLKLWWVVVGTFDKTKLPTKI